MASKHESYLHEVAGGYIVADTRTGHDGTPWLYVVTRGGGRRWFRDARAALASGSVRILDRATAMRQARAHFTA